MNVSLPAAIDRLYAAFAPVPRPGAIEYCPCCLLAEEEHAVLVEVPLRQLPTSALQPYAANVMFTVGGAADFRYFLPRLLEIGCGEGFDWPDLESLIGRLRHAEWTGWRPEEQRAVREVLGALWAQALTRHPGPDGSNPAPATADVDTVMCAIGTAEDDLEPYLTAWESALTRPEARPAAAAQLRSLLGAGYRSDRGQPRLTNPFWQDRDAQAAQVVAWLGGTDLRRALARAGDDADVARARRALDDMDARS